MLVEQVGQLSIDLGHTRMELRRLALVVDGKVEANDVDPLLVATNDTLERVRVRLAELVAAADEQWDEVSLQFDAAAAAVRAEAERSLGEITDN